jgi:hypothetical protein
LELWWVTGELDIDGMAKREYPPLRLVVRMSAVEVKGMGKIVVMASEEWVLGWYDFAGRGRALEVRS